MGLHSGTLAIVAFVVPYGTWQWMGPGVGSGSAQGPDPIAKPKGKSLEVQVIGQQWQFTYRYPSYGGIETQELVIPEGQYVEFHVTSLDVNHSFWAIGLGVKAVGGAMVPLRTLERISSSESPSTGGRKVSSA